MLVLSDELLRKLTSKRELPPLKIENETFQFCLCGNTYSIREELKNAGCRWKGKDVGWIAPDADMTKRLLEFYPDLKLNVISQPWR